MHLYHSSIFYLAPFAFHYLTIGIAHNYKPQRILSYDKKFILETKKIEYEEVVMASFIIKDENEEILFECEDEYRTWDLKSIEWVKNTYDVKVISGDVGTYIYEYTNDNWTVK